MTRFWREGHYRRGPYGNHHWVEGHWVERYGGGSYGIETSYREWDLAREGKGVDPNARCPICGALVYFYWNEVGSRVYFDALGPPWPKHPCTDHEYGGDGGLSLSLEQIIASSQGARVHRESSPLPPRSELLVVTNVRKNGKRRIVIVTSLVGEAWEVHVSPPPPSLGSIAIALTHRIEWFDPVSGNQGFNLIWRKTRMTADEDEPSA